MVKIINGKKYSTETAKELGSYWNGYGITDFNHKTETLYQKKTGEYFLHGEGGPLTEYCSYCGTMRGSGEKIIPLTIEEAEKWAENHINAEEYEAIFGPVEE